MKIEEINDIIIELNDKICNEDTDFSTNLLFTLHSAGLFKVIEYLDVVIWNEDEDEREWIESINDYEPLKGFLIRKHKELVRDLNRINLES
jgi:hypothetical protein